MSEIDALRDMKDQRNEYARRWRFAEQKIDTLSAENGRLRAALALQLERIDKYRTSTGRLSKPAVDIIEWDLRGILAAAPVASAEPDLPYIAPLSSFDVEIEVAEVHEDRGRRWETEQSPALPSVTHAFEPMRQSDPSIGDICALCSELRERHPAAPAAEDR